MDTRQQTGPGSIDLSFGDQGKSPLIFPNGTFSSVWGITLTPESRILAVGALVTTQFIVGCLSKDGFVDTSFGQFGSMVGQFDQHPSVGRAVHVLEDGKVLVSGTVVAHDQLLPAATRLLANGNIDTTFAEGGTYIFPPGKQSVDNIATVSPLLKQSRFTEGAGAQSAVLDDGKIMFSLPIYRDGHGLVIRLTADGLLDTRFNDMGYVSVHYPDPDIYSTYVASFLITSSGEIVVCGIAEIHRKQEGEEEIELQIRGFLARYSTDGRLDGSFGDGGFFILEGPAHTMADSVVETEDGNFIGVGKILEEISRQEAAMAFGVTAAGRIDPGFNNGQINPLKLPRSEWYSAAITPSSNRTVATGANYDQNAQRQGIIVGRYLSTGSLDSDFGNGNGWTVLDPGPSAHVAMQGDNILIYHTGNVLPRVCSIVRLLG